MNNLPNNTEDQKSEVINVFGEPIEVLVSSESSNNTCCVFIQTSPPGGGPPPHKHEREEEVFHLLEGTYEFFENGAWVPFTAGQTRISKRDTFHGFRNIGQTTGRLLFYTNHGGLDEYFRTISALQLPDDKEKLVEISKHFGYYYLPK